MSTGSKKPPSPPGKRGRPPTKKDVQAPLRPTVRHDTRALPTVAHLGLMNKEVRQREIVHELIKERESELPHLYGFPFYKWSKEIFESTRKMCFLVAANQISKPLDVQELIPTIDGFKSMEDIVVGDIVFGADGKKTKVIDIPYCGIDDAYSITFNDGSEVIAGANHDWVCKGPEERFRKTFTKKLNAGVRKWDNPGYGKWGVRTTQEIIDRGKYSPSTSPPRRYCIPVAEPVDEDWGILFDPYLVGLYIGNGSGRIITFNFLDDDVYGYCNSAYGLHVTTEERRGRADVRLGLVYKQLSRFDDISYRKRIPDEYLHGSIEQRKFLLAGLMDTDGTCSASGQNYNYCTTSPGLADDVKQLVTSLGGIAQIKQYPSYYMKEGVRVDCRDHYVVTIWTTFNPFKSKRKSERWKTNDRYKHERVMDSIRYVGKRKLKCITVDNADGTFLCTKDHIVTHNSSTAIRKNIEWACNKDLWPKLWPNREPKQFFYFYPTAEIATSEFLKKWVPEFLPRGAMREHEWYGWEAQMSSGDIVAIHFRSGVSIYFKGYAQKISNLQSSTVDMITADEEMPEEYAAELLARLFGTDGYWLSVFTATLGQETWYRTMERIGESDEAYPNAAKWIVSMYDCMTYADGSPSPWTIERIKEKEGMCSTDNERLRRIMGRFVKDVGRRYPSFEPSLIVRGDGELPISWKLYSVVDIGSGRTATRRGASNGAVLFLGVNPEYTKGKVITTWRGDGIETTSGDIMDVWLRMARTLPKTVQNVYDFGSKEFGLTAQRANVPFIMCNKDKTAGEGLVNFLFKVSALSIPPGLHDNQKLIAELMMVPIQKHTKATDDLSDALKYVCMAVPWNHKQILKEAPKGTVEFLLPNGADTGSEEVQEFPDPGWTKEQRSAWEINCRRGFTAKVATDDWGVNEEIAEWNDAYG